MSHDVLALAAEAFLRVRIFDHRGAGCRIPFNVERRSRRRLITILSTFVFKILNVIPRESLACVFSVSFARMNEQLLLRPRSAPEATTSQPSAERTRAVASFTCDIKWRARNRKSHDSIALLAPRRGDGCHGLMGDAVGATRAMAPHMFRQQL